MIRRPPRSTLSSSSAASDVYKRQEGVAVSLGLLGSVSGFIKAFGSFSGLMDPTRLTAGLKEAYYTTLVGLTLSIIGMVSCYIFDFFRPETAGPVKK